MVKNSDFQEKKLTSRFLRFKKILNSRKYIENILIFCDVISGRRWRHRNKSSGGIQDLGLNFDMQNKFFNFDHPDSLESVWKEAYFSIFKVEKIVEKMPKSKIWNLFYTNSNMLNPMSISVFLDREVRKIPHSNSAGYHWIPVLFLLQVTYNAL